MTMFTHRARIYRMQYDETANANVATLIHSDVPCLYAPEERQTLDPNFRIRAWTEGVLYSPNKKFNEGDIVQLSRPDGFQFNVISASSGVMGAHKISHYEYATRERLST